MSPVQRPLSIQHFKVGRGSSLVAKGRDADSFLQVGNSLLLANAHFMELFIPDQRVGNLAESTLDGLSVEEERLLILGLGESQVSTKGSACEDRLAYLGAIRPGTSLGSQKARKSAASAEGTATGSGQSDLRKKLRLGDPYLGIRRDQDLLGLTNIRTALNDRRRKAGWKLRAAESARLGRARGKHHAGSHP